MDNNTNTYSTTPQTKGTIEALWHLQKIILDSLDFNQVVKKIVDGLLTELGYLNLGYRIIVLTLVDETRRVLKRISLSSTPEAARAMTVSAVPFHEIEIPLEVYDNLLIKAINEQKPYTTHYWPDIFKPILATEEALANQKAAGIKTSMIYPVIVKEKSIGALIFSLIKEEEEVSDDEKDLIRGFTDIVGLAVQNSQLYSSLESTTKKLESANIKLKEVDKLKDEFVSLASHELRTPMTIIKSYLWMILEREKSGINEKQKTYLDRAYASTERLINLVNDMLNVSRIESGRLTLNLKSTDIAELANTVYQEMLPKAQELEINLEITKPEVPLPKVLIDPERIEQVLINLVGNSLKFTPKDGKISISFSTKESFVIITISDTGKGIAKEDLPKLFQKFGMIGNNYLTKQSTQGTGLGLYLSKSIIELHGGKIWVESEGEGKGSKFSFTLKTAGGEA